MKICSRTPQLLTADIRGRRAGLPDCHPVRRGRTVACPGLGLVPHELAVEKGMEPSVITSAKRLAGDYRALATEVLTRIAELLRADAS